MTTKQIQHLLAYLGYDPGDIDGIAGKNTMDAVAKFQTDYGLTADGDPGTMTQKMLIGAVAGTAAKAAKAETSGGAETAPKTGTFWDDIRYFTRGEFRCQCGGKYCDGFPAEPAEETVRMADEIRRRAGVPLTVNSGLRCERHNAAVGGVANSLHRTGQAVDLGGGITPSKLQTIAEAVQAEMIPGRGGLGLYNWGIHIDNGKRSRWNG